MAAPSPDASAAPSPLHETARGPSHRRPSSRPAPMSVTQSSGTHLRPPTPALAATAPYGTVHPHVPPSSRYFPFSLSSSHGRGGFGGGGWLRRADKRRNSKWRWTRAWPGCSYRREPAATSKNSEAERTDAEYFSNHIYMPNSSNIIHFIARVLMPWKGFSQINVVDERTFSDKQHHHSQSQWSYDADDEHWPTENIQELANLETTKRARWNHQMKQFLIDLLKEHDVPGFRTHNAWSKDAWTNITRRVNAKFGTSYSVGQVKQKEQDLKKAYRSVKDLLAESGFGWDSERMMVTAPASVWASFTARKNNKDALHWQDRSFPYYDALCSLYDGRHAEGRTRQGMDHYASKAKNVLVPSTQTTQVPDTYNSPSPTLNAPGESDLQFQFDDENEEANLDFSQLPSNPAHQPQAAHTSTHMHTDATDSRRSSKKRKSKVPRSDDGFHERYLKLKKEEIDRFAAIEEKKLEDPYSIRECVNMVEHLDGLQMGDILVAADIFKCKQNRELFLSFSSDQLRLAWIKREIGRAQTNLQSLSQD